jgi:ADP-ribose pyrophosphatase
MTTLKSKQDIYQGRIINLARHEVELPNGAVTMLDIFEHPGASAVVPFDGSRVTLIRQYRYAAGGYLWEIPAGTLEQGEDPLACAQRELTEEAGFKAGRITRLGRVLTVPSFCTEIIHLFLAEDLVKAATAHEADEVIDDVRQVSFAEAFEMIARGEICDGKSIAGLTHAARVTGHLQVT